MNWGNSQGAKGPSCFAIPLAMYRSDRLQSFRPGTRKASPVAYHVLVTVLSLQPRRNVMSSRSAHAMPCCLRPYGEDSASGSTFFSRPILSSLALRPGDLLPILIDGFVGRLHQLRFLH